jgi:hypothetical protein
LDLYEYKTNPENHKWSKIFSNKSVELVCGLDLDELLQIPGFVMWIIPGFVIIQTNPLVFGFGKKSKSDIFF